MDQINKSINEHIIAKFIEYIKDPDNCKKIYTISDTISQIEGAIYTNNNAHITRPVRSSTTK